MTFDDNNPDEVFDDEPEPEVVADSDEQSNRSFRMMMIGLAAIGGLGVLLIALIFISRQNERQATELLNQQVQMTNTAIAIASQNTPIPLPTDTPPPTNTAVATSTPAATVTPALKDLVDTALAAPNFKTLASLLQTAGLADTLKGPGPFTIFAPTDDAFAQIAPESLDALKKDPAKLAALLKYHVIQGAIKTADMAAQTEAKTLEGDALALAVKNNKQQVNDAALTGQDVDTANGVIHAIDRVLIPAALRNDVAVLIPPTAQPGATQVASQGTPAKGTAVAQVQGTATAKPAAGATVVPTRVPPQAATATAAASKGITSTQPMTGTAGTGGMPATGAGDNVVMWLLAAAGLVGVLVVARRMRTAQN